MRKIAILGFLMLVLMVVIPGCAVAMGILGIVSNSAAVMMILASIALTIVPFLVAESI